MLFEDEVNLRLVNLNLRPGYLIQYFNEDINEFSYRIYKCTTFSNINPIKKSSNYIFFIKDKRNGNFLSTEDDIARVLGYKTVVPFEKLNRDKEIYIHRISANNNEIFCVVDGSPDMKEYYEELVNTFNEKYPSEYKTTFSYKLQVIYSAKSIARKLYEGIQELNEREINEMWNYIYQNDAWKESKFSEVIDLKNPVHRGMLVTYLMISNMDPIEQFYPLTCEQSLYVDKVITKRENEMVKLILHE